MEKIPRCMSTQHPDNVNLPFFAQNAQLGGEDEIQEAYYAFSHLGCDEQMWDCEGKEVDNYVVKKLLTLYEPFFKERRLGRDLFLTLRVPNPTVERAEAKVLLETLESIPRSFDAAKLFYQDETPPIFEVILPMTASARCLDRVYRYYCDFVVGKQARPLGEGEITIAEWIGQFKPERINVIPLFETMEQMLEAHAITREYLQDKEVSYQRVFLARSDPAMNYGLISAVLLNKIALWRLGQLENELGIKLYPIIGVGSAPFRGNFKPTTVGRVMEEYPSVHTFTVQSAFKYDYPPELVREAIAEVRCQESGPPQEVDEGRCLELIKRYSAAYREQVVRLAPLINELAKHVPSRRKRKLHIGLFGYARELDGAGIKLPRAIKFTAALYSVGLPPEVLGLGALSRDDLRFVRQVYLHFDADLRDALRYLNPEALSKFLGEEPDLLEELAVEVEPDREHRELTSQVMAALRGEAKADITELVLRAAHLRRFLG